jgi:DNA-directed RNA polymerase subunit RPC12/RpoP
MPWKCPACQTRIAHDGESPEPKRVYRCHVCHLELVLDERTRKLTGTPFHTDRPNGHTTDPKS